MFSKLQLFIVALFSSAILHIFSNPAPAPAGFEFINPALAGFGKVKSGASLTHTHTHTHTNHFMAILGFVQDYLGERAPHR